ISGFGASGPRAQGVQVAGPGAPTTGEGGVTPTGAEPTPEELAKPKGPPQRPATPMARPTAVHGTAAQLAQIQEMEGGGLKNPGAPAVDLTTMIQQLNPAQRAEMMSKASEGPA